MSNTPEAAPEPSAFLATAVEAVRLAGRMQLDAVGAGFSVRKKGVIDLVTEVDLAIERTFRQLVAERYPDHDVLGEEFGAPGTAGPAARHLWIFDPIDGTTNFAHGFPIFCSSLALEIDAVVTVAAVYDPTRDELYTAERGRGAWLNGQRLTVSTNDRLVDSLLVTGFPYTVHEDAEEMLGLFGAFLSASRAVRRLGSAALDMCYVAAGRMEGFWERGLGAWDIAAGALLVEEAGGHVTDLDGGPFVLRSGQLVASNGRVHAEMLTTIARYTAERARKRTQ
jgi:myo-inositol-1(or 4)-monophosphatase